MINIMDGKRPEPQLMDVNGDGIYNVQDAGMSRMDIAPGASKILVKGDKIVLANGSSAAGASSGSLLEFNRMPEMALRPSWQQVK